MNVTTSIVLVTSQKRNRMITEIAGVFFARATLEIIEGHIGRAISNIILPSAFNESKRLILQTCNKLLYHTCRRAPCAPRPPACPAPAGSAARSCSISGLVPSSFRVLPVGVNNFVWHLYSGTENGVFFFLRNKQDRRILCAAWCLSFTHPLSNSCFTTCGSSH